MNRLLLISISPAVLLVILTGPFVQVGIAQLGLPASLVGGLVALQMLLSVLRPWLGRLGDRHPAGRAGRVTLLQQGLALTWCSLPLLLLGLLQLGRHWSEAPVHLRVVAVAGEVALMGGVGLGNQLAQTMQTAKLIEQAPFDQRPAVVRRLWVATNLFTVLVSGLSAVVLHALRGRDLSQQLLGLWGIWVPVVLIAAVVGLGGVGGERLWLRGASGARIGSSGAAIQPGEDGGEADAAANGGPLESPPHRVLRGGLLAVLLLAHAPLYSQEVLIDPWASDLFGWPLAATATLAGSWALGTLAGQLVALRRQVQPQQACLGVALVYSLLALRAPLPELQRLPIPLLVAALGLASGGLQLWLAGEVGARCAGRRIGETVGWLGAALVLSRCLGVALAGPLLDGAGVLAGEQSAAAFGLAFGALALLMAAGAWSCRRLQRNSAG